MSGPAWEAFAIVKREGQEKAIWIRIGAAFENQDGSINIALDALPTNAKIQLRRPQPREDRGGGRGGDRGGHGF